MDPSTRSSNSLGVLSTMRSWSPAAAPSCVYQASSSKTFMAVLIAVVLAELLLVKFGGVLGFGTGSCTISSSANLLHSLVLVTSHEWPWLPPTKVNGTLKDTFRMLS